MAQANGANLSIGAGAWYFDRFDVSGNPTGPVFMGSGNKGEITPNVTIKEFYDGSKAGNPLLASVPTQQKPTLALELGEWTPQNLALAFLGSQSLLAQPAGNVTGEQLIGLGHQPVTAQQGMILRTAKRNISNVVLHATLPGGGSAITLVSGTDYAIEASGSGFIRVISTAANGATSVTADYAAAAATTPQILAGVTPSITGALTFIGDPTYGPTMDVDLWRVQVSPSSAIGFNTTDFATLPLSFAILKDTLHDDLYRITYR